MRDRLEKRLAPRRTAQLPATIKFSQTDMACIVRNVSDTGAKIEVASVGKVPNTVTLIAEGHRPQLCRVIWRTIREMGVQFI